MSTPSLSPICQQLLTTDPNTAVDSIVVDGATVTVTNFVTVDEKQGLAFFLTATGVTVVDCSELSAVNFT
ncbi:hypothetical protein [Tuberibacillus calidus]|mgnify:CR=1 FL=1|jgi:hypothetical protein|uniref:hypothetical protein n=1 Tax=Tuberibacillus calidus TaxID=340097 RepID=UPI000416BDF7|nr:hypothetical protein [Tuberibacillus calidus]